MLHTSMHDAPTQQLRVGKRISQGQMAEWLNTAILWNTKDAWIQRGLESSVGGFNYERMVILWTIKETWLQKRVMMREESHWGSDTKEMQGVT